MEDFAGDGPYHSLDAAQTTLSVGQAFELGGKRSARVASGRAEVEAARARQTQAAADFAFDLADAYAGAEAAELRLAFAQEALKLAEEDARVARSLVDAGREAEFRALQVQATVFAARAEVELRRTEREAAFLKLTALAGAPAPLTSVSESLLDHPVHAPTLGDALKTPAYLAAQAEREAAARRVRLEQARAAPDVTVSVGVRRYGDSRSTAMVAGVSAPIPLFDRNRGNETAARAELEAAEIQLAAARRDAEAELRVSASRMGAADGRLAAARQTEQAAQEAYRLGRLGYEGGKLPLIEVLNAQRTLAEARERTLDAQLARLTAEAALARLEGREPFGDAP